MDIHFFEKDILLVGQTGKHRRMVAWIDKWMQGWIKKKDLSLEGQEKSRRMVGLI